MKPTFSFISICRRTLVVGIVLLGVFYCCRHQDASRDKLQSLLAEYIGNELKLPADSAAFLFGREYGINALNSDYIIVSYLKPEDCTACHLKLPFWKAIGERLDTISRASATTLLIIAPDTLQKVAEFLETAHYDYPIIIDTLGRFTAMNRLPETDFLHTMLIDANRKIIGLGNPVYDGDLERWYISKIAGINQHDANDNRISIGNTTKDLGTVKRGSNHQLEFLIKNNTDSIIQLAEASTACDCVEVLATDLQPKSNNVVAINFNPTDDEGAFHKTIVLRYSGIERPVIIHLYGYIE